MAFPLPEEGATGHLTVDLVFAVLESKSHRECGFYACNTSTATLKML